MAMLIATHELGLVASSPTRVCFRQAGRIVERGCPARIVSQPAHPSARRFLKPLIEGSRG
jgi:ABC-type dipeptide/oligopeptide/nickel transport system ATPase component